LLEALRCQETGGLFSYSIVVADNDQSESARSVVSGFLATGGITATYCVQPERNIALTRNKALASGTGEFCAFIDDDEVPAKDWLLTMFNACNKYGADGVLGPVEPFFENEPPGWIIKGKFYDRPRHETGFVIPWTDGRTGNLLFKRAILTGIDPVFQPKFGSGGEDRDFFARMIPQGHVFVWCDEAVAFETVPPVRWNRTFMLKRALLRGKMSLNHRSIGLGAILSSMAAIPLYTLALPFLILSGQHHFMKYLIKLCDHAGRILALLGFNPVKETYVTE
jgi:cellulose synthase/poly-beta-1,6-N-acetylglucosamine synthase-like glycosyltransferase